MRDPELETALYTIILYTDDRVARERIGGVRSNHGIFPFQTR